MSLAQWFGWLLSIPISWLLAWLLTFLVSVPRRVWYKLRNHPFKTIWETPFGLPKGRIPVSLTCEPPVAACGEMVTIDCFKVSKIRDPPLS